VVFLFQEKGVEKYPLPVSRQQRANGGITCRKEEVLPGRDVIKTSTVLKHYHKPSWFISLLCFFELVGVFAAIKFLIAWLKSDTKTSE